MIPKHEDTEPCSPSERLLSEILSDSIAGFISLSDVVVVWTDEDGTTRARRATEVFAPK